MKKNQSVKDYPKFNLTDLAQGQEVQILTTYHCLYVANSIYNCLIRAGIKSAIITEPPKEGYTNAPHFVICPQMFQVLPEVYVAFQMEQTINSRWFTGEYIQTLKNAFAIFDYSLVNIRYLNHHGFNPSKIYYQPIDYRPFYHQNRDESETKTAYDVLFYGDANNERRQTFLTELSKKFRVKVVSEVFDEELYQMLANTKVIVNIHYYTDALLETTRIYEALSLNKLIVSETSSDMGEHTKLREIVDFVEVNDVQAMIARVQYWLEHEDERVRRIENNQKALSGSPNMFDHFFYRFLLATENITFDQFWELAGHRYRLTSNKLCLHLPEYTDRTDSFIKDNEAYGFTFFPGLRHRISWVGCGLSYKFMMMLARKQEFSQIEVCEDDVQFSNGFEARWDAIKDYLAHSEEKWDIFSGLLSDLSNDAVISSVVNRDGYKIAVTNKMIGAIFNLYSERIYNTIIEWDETDYNLQTNTIDRYLEQKDELKIITTSPFLATQKAELYSTIWEHEKEKNRVSNAINEGMIQRSTKLLKEKIDSFEFLNTILKLDLYGPSKEKAMIAGMVVLYQPKVEELLRNIATYIPFINHLYVIDNSPKPNEVQMKERLQSLSPNIEYIANHKNQGWAKPLNTIADKAIDEGYKMLLTMDQDSSFDHSIADKYFTYAISLLILKPHVALVTLNSDRQPLSNLKIGHHYHEVMRTITSGSIFQLGIFKEIGGADERLFLDEVDREYCFRAIKYGYKVYSFHNLYLTHNLGNLRKVGYLGLFSKRYTVLHSPARLYFIKRNFLLVSETYASIFPEEFVYLKREHKKKIKYQLLCSHDWYLSLFHVIRGYIDYKRRRFG
ncbi:MULTISPECIES: glycosyltransferase family protein [Chitinophagaceae]